jgi:CxxC motif-containing protein (DUF1111 family)
MDTCIRYSVRLAVVFGLAASSSLYAQSDPGIRGGAPGGGGPLPGLSAEETGLFGLFREVFQEIEDVAAGLGPRFNLDSCAGCHSQPAIGGSSPAVNPEVTRATANGASNGIPSFLSQTGPVREARRIRAPNGQRDGNVVPLFTITGRADSQGCIIAQPDFTQLHNFSFRIPTPTFGLGLVEAIPEQVLRGNLARESFRKAVFGISGRFNTDSKTGAVTRFGWKAQVATLLSFAAQAYNVEMGVTSDLFPIPGETACAISTAVEDQADPVTGDPSDVVKFAEFMRRLDQPKPAPDTPSIVQGRALFDNVGCALCHTPALSTGRAAPPALASRRVNLFSDLALHSMGDGLADRVVQGVASGEEFRTAPLWGLGQRVFFLHDGRTSNLLEAIKAHASRDSEANRSVAAFEALKREQKQDLLNFLRSL